MEADSALVWADGTAALNTVCSVYLDISFVVKPWNAENDDALRLHNSFEDFEIHEIWMLDYIWGYAFKNFLDSLVEFLFSWVPGNQIGHETVYVVLCELVHDKFRFKLGDKKCVSEESETQIWEIFFVLSILEEETGVDVECTVTVLLVEAAGIFECHDEVLVHDETQTCSCRSVKTILA